MVYRTTSGPAAGAAAAVAWQQQQQQTEQEVCNYVEDQHQVQGGDSTGLKKFTNVIRSSFRLHCQRVRLILDAVQILHDRIPDKHTRTHAYTRPHAQTRTHARTHTHTYIRIHTIRTVTSSPYHTTSNLIEPVAHQR